MEDLLGGIAFFIAIISFIFVVNNSLNQRSDDYKIYDECYQIEEKFYCK